MIACGTARTAQLATGAMVSAAGLAFVGAGLWARRDVSRVLARERITGAGGTVANAAEARKTAELIRRNTLQATGGRTYAEVDPYVAPDGSSTADAARAGKDQLTGEPAENPDHALWIQSTALQTALMHAYTAFRLAELTIGLGATFVAAGVGLAAAGRRAEG